MNQESNTESTDKPLCSDSSTLKEGHESSKSSEALEVPRKPMPMLADAICHNIIMFALSKTVNEFSKPGRSLEMMADVNQPENKCSICFEDSSKCVCLSYFIRSLSECAGNTCKSYRQGYTTRKNLYKRSRQMQTLKLLVAENKQRKLNLLDSIVSSRNTSISFDEKDADCPVEAPTSNEKKADCVKANLNESGVQNLVDNKTHVKVQQTSVADNSFKLVQPLSSSTTKPAFLNSTIQPQETKPASTSESSTELKRSFSFKDGVWHLKK